MRVLVTGANGFVGRRFLETNAGGHELVALARGSGPALPDVEWIEHDLTEPLAAARLPERIDAVVHLAQSRRYREFPEGARDVFEVNTRSTFELLEYARRAGARTFVFASTGGVYAPRREPLVETDPVEPSSFYFGSKYAGELLVGSYGEFFSTVILRPFAVYGPGQERMLVPTLIERMTSGETVTVQGDPGLRINPIYVDDVVSVVESALGFSGSGVFNVAGAEAVTVTELVELIGDVAGFQPVVEHTDAESGDLVGDNTRMREELGVVPQVSLREGLHRTVGSRLPAA
jgi:nucleoside-diphosphate-sugar epimerase